MFFFVFRVCSLLVPYSKLLQVKNAVNILLKLRKSRLDTFDYNGLKMEAVDFLNGKMAQK